MRFRKANGFTTDHIEEYHHQQHRKQQEDEDSHHNYNSTSNCYSSQEDDTTMFLLLTKTIASAITTGYSHIIGSKRKSKTFTSLIRFLVFMLLVASSLFLCILLSRRYLLSMFTYNNHDDVIPVSAATATATATARRIEQTVESPKDILLDVLNLYNKDRKQGQIIGGGVDFGGPNSATGTTSTRTTRTNIRTRAVGVATTTGSTTTTLTGRYLYPCHHEDIVQIKNETKHSLFCNVEFPLLDLSDHDDDWEDPSLRNPWDGGSFSGGNTANALHQKDRVFAHLPVVSQKDYAVLTKRGYKGGFMTSQVNQDRPFIFHHYLNSPMEEGHFVMGIMDGHGTFGHFVAQLVLMELIRELLVNQLIGLFSKEVQEKHIVDNHKWIELFQKIDQKLPKDLVDDGGCTASIVAKLSNDTIVVANTGDSETFIVGYQKKSVVMTTEESLSSASFNTTTTTTTTSLSSLLNVTILYKSKKHKAHIPEEMARIESAGGVVELPQTFFGTEMSSRVLVPIMSFGGGIMSLAMSRSFGDALAKAVGVIVDPTVDVLRITELRNQYKKSILGNNNGTILPGENDNDDSIQMFAVSVSDGLFDKVPIEEIAQRIALGFESDANDGSLYKACEELIKKSSKIWLERSAMFGQSYRDDISIAVHRL